MLSTSKTGASAGAARYSMPTVTILPVELTATVAAGESLLDAGEHAEVEMVAACFNGSCGTCVVEVIRGGENLAALSSREAEVLAAGHRDPARFRLACSAKVVRGEVTIRQLD